jgi:D-alanyl-lipoteichoic acid acyltransferase DltB (MBOAT superfamily)
MLIRGALFFSIQISGDFSGYSDIARGTARLLGFDLMLNFRRPYFSLNITDFWRRWHISLSTWLRDYLYIPLGGNRVGRFHTYRNLMITMCLGGLWHGASWNFVVWGMLHGVYLAVHRAWRMLRDERLSAPQTSLGQLAGGMFTFILVTLTWIFFRSPDFASTLDFFYGLLTLRGGGYGDTFEFVRLAFFVGLILLVDLPQHRSGDEECVLRWHPVVRVPYMALLLILIVLLAPVDETPFIYFQF